MMNNQTSRRNFLSTMAILSAGVAFGKVADFVSPQPASGLEHLWDSFCKHNNGKLLQQRIQLQEQTILTPCKGHIYQPGKLVYFPAENILAQPTWIYWSEGKRKPDDVLITFYQAEGKKIFRLNRFELESITALSESYIEEKLLPVLKEAIQHASSAKAEKKWKAVTRIQKGQTVEIITHFSNKQTTLVKKFIANS